MSISASVSELSLDKVRAYILNQEDHHKKISFADEYQKFIEALKIEGKK